MAHPNLKRLARERKLILGSRSPRRVKLLTDLGISFEQIIPEIEERRLPDEPAFPYAQRLAEEKARWAMERLDDNQIVITCDTIVVLGDVVLEKPGDEQEALEILTTLSGRKHVVCTAVSLADRTQIISSGYETTGVQFNTVTPDRLREYIATGEPMDKAGAYGIQGMGAFLVDSIEGNLDTVIGLPRTLLECLAGEVNGTLG